VTAAAPTRGAAGEAERDPGSFRDPSGFVYRREGRIYREIDPSFAERFAAVESTGLLRELAADGKVLAYEDVALELAATQSAARVIQPAVVPFISYPYEWSFGQLRDAALLTLDLQLAALEKGLTMRDASAYNIQFIGARPVHIDTLSFEPAEPGRPWIAYRQFCEHFLGPLALMARRDIRIGRLLRSEIEGIPLDLVSRLLPGWTRLNLGLGAHVHLHARAQRRYAGAGEVVAERVASTRKVNVANLVTSLRSTVAGLHWEPRGTEWADYEMNTNYGAVATAAKERLVASFLAAAGGSTVWDLGANIGRFSRLAATEGRRVLAFDVDPAAVERNYRTLHAEGREDILPLVMDLANPSPALGWAHGERASLTERGPADVALALGLVHHLAIGRNIPLRHLAELLARLSRQLIIEFVPRDDSMVRQLLATREDVFADYTPDGFRTAFDPFFEHVGEAPVEGSSRVLHHLRQR
jgi:2-polyprenyl-3-methyl-5-hydroxy-6-metoxy-1,4-benzoquinol methylase